MAIKSLIPGPRPTEASWSFEAGDRVPEWLMRQTNCVLWFDRDAAVIESAGGFQLYPMSPMQIDDTLVLAEILDQQKDSEVEHVLPIKTHLTPRNMSLN